MVARKVVSPELLAEGKSLYEETLTPVHEIWTRMGLSRRVFRQHQCPHRAECGFQTNGR